MIYLLKAKGQYFILIKFPNISFLRQEKISHEDFANIFKIQDKLESEAKVSKSRIQGTDELIKGSKINAGKNEKASVIRT